MMRIADHGGPKAQIHLEGLPDSIFFAQVRDAVAHAKMQERTVQIAAFYVSDMASAPSWEDPGADNWIGAEAANFVVGADVTGGMGAPEIVPFATEDAALRFVSKSGGRVALLNDIPSEAILGAVDLPQPEEVVQ